MVMNIDMTELIQLCILELDGCVKPDYELWRNSAAKNPGDEDPLGWLYLARSEHIIKQRMEEYKVETELFDDIYFAICWEMREKSLEL